MRDYPSEMVTERKEKAEILIEMEEAEVERERGEKDGGMKVAEELVQTEREVKAAYHRDKVEEEDKEVVNGMMEMLGGVGEILATIMGVFSLPTSTPFIRPIMILLRIKVTVLVVHTIMTILNIEILISITIMMMIIILIVIIIMLLIMIEWIEFHGTLSPKGI